MIAICWYVIINTKTWVQLYQDNDAETVVWISIIKDFTLSAIETLGLLQK